MRVVVCGGGTGGHVYPALAAVAELRRFGVDADEIMWIGTEDQMEETLVPRAGLKLETIGGGPIVGVPLWTKLVNGVRLAWSMEKVGRLLRRFRPRVLLMTGGYVNVPVALVARAMRLPAAIYLPDVEPGSAIRFLSRFADKVACTAAASRAYFPHEKVVVTGYPVRPELRAARALSKEEALAAFELAPERRTLFVFGGSRGARSINRALAGILPMLLPEFQVIHISGSLDWAEVQANATGLPAELRAYYRPYPYLHERMGSAFRAADLVVARAGASMLGEAPAFGLPSILVPYPHAWRYQKVNADFLAGRGAAIRLDDDKLAQELLPTVQGLLRDPQRLAAMGAAVTTLDRPRAAEDLAQLLLVLGGKSAQGPTSPENHPAHVVRPAPEKEEVRD
ncbi:MAG: UDP-N-acetylglucosamine--N-acetylmuramyl-(pentapeptide) pyrophosphoryl-undecaprenol N-acetylglucosamine transferase [Anaerolineae bacterium]|nr:UDP-N-acetylglucosamine--N-acetylmuramyl-(pentapeptide) pyrophosphoryl-undecaprenol N-acetylglucosamine transferase [Anaerolineae bacterium]